MSTSGGRLYFETAGRGPAIVFIHGGQMDRRMWDHQFTAYAKRYKAIRYDVRGFGRTGLPTKGYSDVEDLLGLLNHLKVNRVSIVGLSLGGRIALDFVLAHPDRVESLVLADPGLSGWNWSADQSTLGEARFRAARDEGTKKSAEMWLADPYMVPAMEKPAISKRIREIVMANASGELANPFLNRDLDLRSIDHLAEIHAPSLILIGDRDVPDIQKIVDTLAAGIKGSRKEVIKDSGHITNMEQPEQFDRFVLEFIDRLHSGGSAAGV
ncbi:MAG TPA: alpha/beta fold hydrolase [Blastocatellia bacterium]|nr:alpha/beta fold hydrolase [Blastocatellia bacterium]